MNYEVIMATPTDETRLLMDVYELPVNYFVNSLNQPASFSLLLWLICAYDSIQDEIISERAIKGQTRPSFRCPSP